MKRFSTIFLLAGLTCLGQFEVKIGPIDAVLSPVAGDLDGSTGYQVLRVEAANTDSMPHVLEIRVDRSFNNMGGVRQFSRTFTIDANGVADVRLRCWRNTDMPDKATFYLDGRQTAFTADFLKQPLDRQSKSLQLSALGLGIGFRRGGEDLLILNGLETRPLKYEFVHAVQRSSGTSSKRPPKVHPNQVDEKIADTELWGDHWLDFSPYHLIQLSDESLTLLSKERKKALWTWLYNGGNLLIRDTGKGFLQPEWEAMTLASGGSPGFGRLWIHPAKVDKDEAFFDDLLKVLAVDKETIWATSDLDELFKHFPLKGLDLKLPLRPFLILLFIFSLIIGPANYFYLAKKNKRIWVMVTIPLISLLATLVVLIYALITERGTSQVRRESIVFLDEVHRKANIKEHVGLYSPVSIGSLRFSENTWVDPIRPPNSNINYRLDWSDGQNLIGGWVRAREPFFYRSTREETRRERLTVEHIGENLKVTNGFGAPIRSFCVTNSEGVVYKGKELGVGQSITLNPLGQVPQEGPLVGIQIFKNSNWLLDGDPIFQHFTAGDRIHLNPNRYLVVLDGAPFREIDHNTGKLSETTLVYGIWEARQ